MKRFALLGEPLGHSMSPALHKAIYRQLEIDDASYRTVEIPEERLKGFFSGFRVGGFDGVNVTTPHKATVISLLDEVENKAKVINAVNCIHRVSNKLTGYNTDILGFDYSLRQSGLNVEGSSFAIIGAGGSAQAVGAVLADGGASSVSIFNRSEDKAAELQTMISTLNPEVTSQAFSLDELGADSSTFDCVVNTTTVGMSPSINDSPVPEGFFDSNTLAFDLIYNPKQTAFLAAAEAAGSKTVNGMQMLVAQAVYSVEIWMGGNIVAHVDMNALVRDLEKLIK